MRRTLSTVALFMLVAHSAAAHRLDEYLQGTIFSVAKDRLNADITLTPGVAIFPTLIPEIDTNGDGAISDAEQKGYAWRVLADLSLSIDGQRLAPRLVSTEFPTLAEMKEGRGEVHLQFYADLPRGGPGRKLVFENRHQNKISVYLVNVLVSRDPEITIVSQNRNYTQSRYELDFQQGKVTANDAAGAFAGTFWGPFALIVLAAFSAMTSIRFLRKRRAVQISASLRARPDAAVAIEGMKG
jgi:hypothetical protein